ncbi:hypothetical protein E3E12_05145 [Formicincola oecophyllae]|uniref:Phage holin family protein n=1 Tax=Formicincola oecophyllae TaxID=2558361 RepID=A0A4Y6UC33_9PROT|nr:hypothetical protein [Formicincola oecophyllae]QDH13675.1 hypothetical protein E3E12_05145 [Formicincola oecophyllae]
MTNPFELCQDALHAQGQLFAAIFKRFGMRAVMAAAMVVFLLGAFVTFHGVLWALFYTVLGLGALSSALCVLGFDLLGVLVFGFLMMRGRRPDRAEDQARMKRNAVMEDLRQSLAFSALTALLFGPLGRMLRDMIIRHVRNAFTKRHERAEEQPPIKQAPPKRGLFGRR